MVSTGAVYVNDTANANMTIGLTINQGANDDNILSFKSSDVAAGTIGTSETDDYVVFRKVIAAGGGLAIVSKSDPQHDADSPSLQFFAYSDDSFTNASKTSASSRGRVEFFAFQHDSANTTAALAAGTNAFVFRGGTGAGSASRTLVLFDEAGGLYSITAAQTFDALDDLALLAAYDMTVAPDAVIRNEWEDFTRYHESDLIACGILGGPIDEGGMTCVTQLQRAHNGAIRQLGRALAQERIARLGLEAEVASLKARLN